MPFDEGGLQSDSGLPGLGDSISLREAAEISGLSPNHLRLSVGRRDIWGSQNRPKLGHDRQAGQEYGPRDRRSAILDLHEPRGQGAAMTSAWHFSSMTPDAITHQIRYAESVRRMQTGSPKTWRFSLHAAAFEDAGRAAIVVDTTRRPTPGEGSLFACLS